MHILASEVQLRSLRHTNLLKLVQSGLLDLNILMTDHLVEAHFNLEPQKAIEVSLSFEEARIEINKAHTKNIGQLSEDLFPLVMPSFREYIHRDEPDFYRKKDDAAYHHIKQQIDDGFIAPLSEDELRRIAYPDSDMRLALDRLERGGAYYQMVGSVVGHFIGVLGKPLIEGEEKDQSLSANEVVRTTSQRFYENFRRLNSVKSFWGLDQQQSTELSRLVINEATDHSLLKNGLLLYHAVTPSSNPPDSTSDIPHKTVMHSLIARTKRYP